MKTGLNAIMESEPIYDIRYKDHMPEPEAKTRQDETPSGGSSAVDKVFGKKFENTLTRIIFRSFYFKKNQNPCNHYLTPETRVRVPLGLPGET